MYICLKLFHSSQPLSNEPNVVCALKNKEILKYEVKNAGIMTEKMFVFTDFKWSLELPKKIKN